MTRERKSPEERKSLLLEAANQLFCLQGYSATSVIDIATKAGVKKSTFFYYYPNKEKILYELVSQWGHQVVTTFQEEYDGKNAKDRLTGFVRALALSYRMPLLERLFKDQETALMIGTFDNVLEKNFNPILKDILEQGQKNDCMVISNINVTIHFFWAVVEGLLDAYEEEETMLQEEKQNRLENYAKEAETLLASLLGIETDTVKLNLPAFDK